MRLFLFLISLFLISSCTSAPHEVDTRVVLSDTGSYRASIDPDERVALAKKRKNYITGIRKWDFYSLRNAPEEALSYYISVAEKIPKDQVVRKKIAHVYYLMKNWGRAYAEYTKVPLAELSDIEKDELFSSLFFDETLYDRVGELARFSLSSGALDYYTHVDICYSTIHDCIVGIEAYTGSSEKILSLQSQIKNATKISEAYEYRNLLVAATFYEQKMYRASMKITQEMLKSFPDYIEAKKILGFSYFELGEYEDAKKMLLAYLEKNPKDLECIIRIGEIHARLGDPITSNLYLNNAILDWYTPKINLERRLAYNYSLLWDSVGMMKVLGYLLQDDGAQVEDYAVAVSYALIEWQYSKAESWGQQGIIRYPKSHILPPLLMTALRLSWKSTEAYDLLSGVDEKGLVENPNYLLEKGILLFDKGDIPEAKKIFEDLKNLDGWSEISTEAWEYLSRIEWESLPKTKEKGWWEN